MKTLMVTPYAPARDGIANYAVQEVKALRSGGADVEVLSPLPSAAHHHADVTKPAGMVRLVKLSGSYDRVIVQLFPALVTARCRTSAERVANWMLLAAVARRTELELRVHEIDYSVSGREAQAIRKVMAGAHRITVHTETERTDLQRSFGLAQGEVDVIDHGGSFAPRSSLTKDEARAELSLPADEFVFLSIGFLQDHKGFDRGIRAFGAANLTHASLHVVGSVRVDVRELLDHAELLGRMAKATRGVEFHRRYVGDVEFDRWLTAADALVLPYREIWSSGVIERAKLYGIDVIASNVGGLADQLAKGSRLVDDDEQLVLALRDFAGPERAGTAASSPWDVDAEQPNVAEIEAQIAQRARDAAPAHGGGSATRAVADVGTVAPARSVSARPGVSRMKWLIQRLTHWQLEPLMYQLNRLQQATATAVADLEGRLDQTDHDQTVNGATETVNRSQSGEEST